MSMTPQSVREKTFRTSRLKRGYDEDEVDTFLDEVEAELNRLLAENAALRDQVVVLQSAAAVVVPGEHGSAPAQAALPPPGLTPAAGEMEEMLRRTLLLAQRTADQAVAEAQAEAEQLRSRAREEGQQLLAQATAQAEQVTRETAQHREQMLAHIEGERRRLQDQVEALHGFEQEFRGRLQAYFEHQLRELARVGAATDSEVGPPEAAPAADGPPAPEPSVPDQHAPTAPVTAAPSVPAPPVAPPA
jgi:DivIVA domain-containing protein